MSQQDNYDYEYLSRIKEHYPVYSESERKIADFFMNNAHPDATSKVASMSAVELAEATGTSSATIVRFCHALGFKGLTELKYYITKGILSPNRRHKPLTADDSISVVRQKIANMNKIVIDDTMSLLDDNDLELAVDKLEHAAQVLLFAEGGSGCTAKLAELMFMQIGLKCAFPEDGFLQMLYINQLTDRDVVIAISHSGRAANTIEAVKYAKESGAFIIGMTSIVNSPLTKACDVVLYNSSMEQEYFSNTAAARICELNVISILHSALLQRSDNNLSIERQIHQLYEVKRVKPTR